LSGRLGCEEGLEQFLAVFGRNADAIVAHPDLDTFAELAGRDLEGRAETAVALTAALAGGIETIAYEVQEYANQLLGHDVHRREIAVEVALQRDIEALVLRTGTVIGEVQGFFDERVQISRLPIAAAAARVLQHASHYSVSAAAVLDNLLQIPGQHLDCFQNLGAFAGTDRGDGLSRGLLQLVEQLDRESGKIVDEVEGVFDLVRDAGGQLTERCHLLRMDQTCLCRLQLA